MSEENNIYNYIGLQNQEEEETMEQGNKKGKEEINYKDEFNNLREYKHEFTDYEKIEGKTLEDFGVGEIDLEAEIALIKGKKGGIKEENQVINDGEYDEEISAIDILDSGDEEDEYEEEIGNKLGDILSDKEEGIVSSVRKVDEAIEEDKLMGDLISGELEEEPDRELSTEEKYESIKKTEVIREAIKEEMEVDKEVSDEVTFGLKDKQGNIIKPREVGAIKVKMIPIDQIVTTTRTRLSEGLVINLTEQIRQFGLLQPIHVVPYGQEYLLVNGYRRLQAMRDLGFDEITAVVDNTIPASLVKYYEAIINGVLQYTFSEKVAYGQKLISEQGTLIGYDTIEGILGLGQGEFLKALYIDSMKGDYFEIYQQVEKGKLNIEQGFKKIEKEIAKAEKEMNGADALNSGELDDQLRNTDELGELNNDAGNQELGDRKILDPVLRRSVESRDGGYCQCCGYGKDQPDLMGVFNVHHIIPVQYGGSDNKTNLILLCSNCHKLAHDYEVGRFLPDTDFYENNNFVKKIVVLGNMLQITRQRGIQTLKMKHESVYRQVNAKKTTIGKAIKQLGIDLKGEEYFNGSPYEMFMNEADKINLGKREISELTTLSYGDEEDTVETVVADTVADTVENSVDDKPIIEETETIPTDEINLEDEYAKLDMFETDDEDDLAINMLDEE